MTPVVRGSASIRFSICLLGPSAKKAMSHPHHISIQSLSKYFQIVHLVPEQKSRQKPSMTGLTSSWHFKAQGNYLIIRTLHFSETPEWCPKFRDYLSSSFRQPSLFLRYSYTSHFKCQETRHLTDEQKETQTNEVKTLRRCDEYSCTYLYTFLKEKISGNIELMSICIFHFDKVYQNTYYESHSNLVSHYARMPGFLYPQW